MEKKINARKKAQRLARQRKMRNRRIAMTICLMIAVCLVSVGGTIAWLIDTTDPVQNTFTVGDINITLEETYNTDTDTDGNNDKWEAKLIPGTTYAKDPKVTVLANSEACWLFVKVTETNNPSTYLTYDYRFNDDSEWKQGTGADGIPANVYYRAVAASEQNQYWYLLDAIGDNTNGAVAVKDSIKKESTVQGDVVMPAADATPKITFQAYACQQANRTAAQAWEAIGA